MEMHQLRYFVAVADSGNFTRAARQCFVSQPSLSQQIQKLEDELGHRLFDRLGRRAQLTPAGHAFLERARRVLFDVEDAARAVREQAGDGRLRLGAVPSVAPYLLPELLPELQQRAPNISFEIYEDFRSYLIEEIEGGQLDAAVLSLPPAGKKLEIVPLFSEPLLVTMPKDHPLAAQAALRSTDLAGQKLVLLGDSSSLALQTKRFFGDNHIDVAVACRCAQVKTVKALVAAGVGLAILPKMAAGRDNVPGLVYRELTDASPRREIVLVRHPLRFHGKTEELLLETLQTLGREKFQNPRS